MHPETQQPQESRIYTVLMLLVATIWGFGFIVTRKAMDAGYTTAFVLTARFTIAALVFGIAARGQLPLLQKSEVAGGLFGGLFLFLGFALQTFGLPLTTPSNSALLTSASLVIVPFLAWLVFRQRPPLRVFVGAAICFVGILAISVNPAQLGGFGRGDLLSLLCAVSFAVHAVLMGYFSLRGNALVLNFLQMLVAALCSGVLLFWEGGPKEQLALRPQLLWVLYLAIFSTVIAYYIQTNALRHLSAPRVQILASFESVVAMLFSLLLGYEALRPSLLIGGGLVFFSVLLVERPGARSKALPTTIKELDPTNNQPNPG